MIPTDFLRLVIGDRSGSILFIDIPDPNPAVLEEDGRTLNLDNCQVQALEKAIDREIMLDTGRPGSFILHGQIVSKGLVGVTKLGSLSIPLEEIMRRYRRRINLESNPQ